ncbi:endonuclease/exonuclease/phosphatase family protein [Candidatus Roizmanbacteria bacterium]|nr:endonuclease/exonuclease/phosphatase family protein [Candidatus Roizmanbacteria bacterium]
MIIKLLQWNIWFKEKIESIAATIKKINPDIACFQELSKGLDYNSGIDTVNYIAKHTGFNHYFHEGMIWVEDGSKIVGNGIFSKFPISKSLYISTSIPIKRGAIEKYGSVYIEVQVVIFNDRLTVATDHLTYISQFKETEEKKKEIDRLINIVKNKNSKYLISGDFNAIPNSYTIRNIEKYLLSCGPSYKEKTAFTKEGDVPDYAGWKTGFEWRLDYVFATKDLKVKSAKIIKTAYSDHLPIVTEVEI